MEAKKDFISEYEASFGEYEKAKEEHETANREWDETHQALDEAETREQRIREAFEGLESARTEKKYIDACESVDKLREQEKKASERLFNAVVRLNQANEHAHEAGQRLLEYLKSQRS